MTYKGSRHRLQPGEKSKHDECPIWQNWEKKAKNQRIFDENKHLIEGSNIKIIEEKK